MWLLCGNGDRVHISSVSTVPCPEPLTWRHPIERLRNGSGVYQFFIGVLMRNKPVCVGYCKCSEYEAGVIATFFANALISPTTHTDCVNGSVLSFNKLASEVLNHMRLGNIQNMIPSDGYNDDECYDDDEYYDDEENNGDPQYC